MQGAREAGLLRRRHCQARGFADQVGNGFHQFPDHALLVGLYAPNRGQVSAQFTYMRISFLRLLFKESFHNAHQSRREIRYELGYLRRWSLDVLAEDGDCVLALKWRAPGEHLIKQHPGRVKIGALDRFLATCLLRRHVLRRTHDRACGSHRAPFQAARQTEVHQYNAAGFVEHDIARLDIAMDDAGAMHSCERLKKLIENRQRLDNGKAAARGDDFIERETLEQFHRIIADRAFPADRIDANEVGMFHPAERTRFLLKAAAERPVLREFGGKDFDRHFTIEHGVVRAIHSGHAAHTERLDQMIATQFAARTDQLKFLMINN